MNEHDDDFKIFDDCVAFKSGATARFRFPVAEALTFGATAVVRLDVPSGENFNENVYGLRTDGQILWQVPARTHVYEDSPYVHLARDGTRVILTNWDGTELTLDPSTGAVLRERQTK